MIREIESMLERYWTWLKDGTSLRALDDWVEITTPYLDRHNDCLQIYARREERGYVLTDDSYVLEDLEQSGCAIESARYRALIATTLNGFGIRRNGKALEVEASAVSFAVRKHNLLQAMLAVEDVAYLATPSARERPPFHDDVVAWLDGSEIRYTPNVNLAGLSGYSHRFEFVIPKSRARPERVLRAFNQPNRTAAQTMAFSWIDTKKARSPGSTAYAILNDVDRPPADEVLLAMRSYEINPIPWSERGAVLEELAQ